MTIRENKYPIQDVIPVRNVLVSVFDKSGLDELVRGILGITHDVMFYSTGGTEKRLKEILGQEAFRYLTPIEAFTGSPEMEGGLVKTLHPKVHGGLLGERGNPHHIEFLEKLMLRMTGTEGVFIDLLVCNFYPFGEVTAQPDVTPEQARVNIDIGGPTMVRSAAKNYHGVAVLTSPAQYKKFLENLKRDGGITARERFELARQAFHLISRYDSAIDSYFEDLDFEKNVKTGLTFVEGD